jgi:hypothetical protein
VTTRVFTGVLLIALPVAYNVLYTLLARSFDYPDILRRPTAEYWNGSRRAGVD